jgi:class 3 adenylate cyclase/tetratricopeptide (TPR) repeat protein
MLCPSCSEEILDAKRFCPNCGVALAATCGDCGAELIPGKRFCGDCGAEATTAVSTPTTRGTAGSDSAPIAERRLCSVMFIDLVGFTPLAEKRDPEEIRELLTRYFVRAQGIVDNYGGTVEKFIGDAVMAVWGAPTANEDDAERAVRAALDIVSFVPALGREAGLDGLQARGGVVTGEVAVTIGKVSEGMVLGDTVNSASRVQSAATPGTVLVDDATWRATSGAIAFEDAGELTLKGKEEIVKAWRALRVVGKRKGLGRSERLEPPFVGRDDELRLVKDLLHATAREQRARLVSITGVPGIGKSRLAWEFLKYVDGLAETVYWHQGRSASYGEGVTFGALGEMIRMRAGITDGEEADSSRLKLSTTVANFVADEPERLWIEPRLAYLLGLGDAPIGDREELFSAWRTFFERISARGLTVMVFEDLQWADPGLMDFVESILEWSRSYPIMVVSISRPELRDQRPGWGAGQRSFTSLHLDPLDDVSMRMLLGGFVSGLSDAVTESVLARAEGVPLYAVETVRMLVDRGVLVEEGGVYQLQGELVSLEIPETLQALVASRLDALVGEQRALLQDAAVLGTSFLPESLLAIHGGERTHLDVELRDLVRKEFLRYDTDPRSPERGQYGFVQGVIREVAVAMLSRRDRSAKHLAAARYYESFNDEELTVIVAAHYASAHQVAPEGAESDEIAERASEWLIRAGERAMSLGSPEQAQELFERAIEVTPSGARRAKALELAAEVMMVSADYAGSIARFEAAIEEYRLVGDHEAVGLATAKLSDPLSFDDRREEAVAMCLRAYNEQGDTGSLNVRAHLAESIAHGHTFGGDFNEVLHWSELSLGLAEQLDDDAVFARALGTRSLALFNVGRHREAVILARGMVTLSEEIGSLREQAMAALGLSLFALPDDPRETVRNALKSAELSRRAGLRALEETNLLNAAETSISLGLWAQARTSIAELATHLVRPESRVWTDNLTAQLMAGSGDIEAARELLAQHVSESAGAMVAHETTMMHGSAQVAYAAGEFVQALETARRAVEMDPMGINSAVAIALWARCAIWLRDAAELRNAQAASQRVRGRWMAAVRGEIGAALAVLEERVDEAGDLYTAAIEAWRALECNLDVAITEVELVHLLGPDHPAAVAGKEAKDILVNIEAQPLLARLEADMATQS